MPPLISRGKIQPVTAQHFHKSAVEASEARCSRLLGRMAVSGAGDGEGEAEEEERREGGGREKWAPLTTTGWEEYSTGEGNNIVASRTRAH